MYFFSQTKIVIVAAENDLAHSIVATVANIDYTLVSPFYEKDTRIMPFKTNKNDTIMVETMYQFNEIPVCVEDGFTAVNLPCTVSFAFVCLFRKSIRLNFIGKQNVHSHCITGRWLFASTFTQKDETFQHLQNIKTYKVTKNTIVCTKV